MGQIKFENLKIDMYNFSAKCLIGFEIFLTCKNWSIVFHFKCSYCLQKVLCLNLSSFVQESENTTEV